MSFSVETVFKISLKGDPLHKSKDLCCLIPQIKENESVLSNTKLNRF